MNRVNVFAIHRCINEGYELIRIFTEKIRISPTKLWRVCNIIIIINIFTQTKRRAYHLIAFVFVFVSENDLAFKMS